MNSVKFLTQRSARERVSKSCLGAREVIAELRQSVSAREKTRGTGINVVVVAERGGGGGEFDETIRDILQTRARVKSVCVCVWDEIAPARTKETNRAPNETPMTQVSIYAGARVFNLYICIRLRAPYTRRGVKLRGCWCMPDPSFRYNSFFFFYRVKLRLIFLRKFIIAYLNLYNIYKGGFYEIISVVVLLYFYSLLLRGGTCLNYWP